MADAFKCDRCKTLQDGLALIRVGFDELQKDGEYSELIVLELCSTCQMTFWQWFKDAEVKDAHD